MTPSLSLLSPYSFVARADRLKDVIPWCSLLSFSISVSGPSGEETVTVGTVWELQTILQLLLPTFLSRLLFRAAPKEPMPGHLFPIFNIRTIIPCKSYRLCTFTSGWRLHWACLFNNSALKSPATKSSKWCSFLQNAKCLYPPAFRSSRSQWSSFI